MSIDDWNSILSSFRQIEEGSLGLLKTGRKDLVAAEYGLHLNNVNFAYYAMCVEKDYEKALNYFYKAAMMAVKNLRLSQSRDDTPLESCLSLLFPVILCGEKKILKYFMTDDVFEPNGEKQYPASYSYVKSLQFILKDDYPTAKYWLERLEMYIPSRWRGGKYYALFLKGIVYHDKNLMEESVRYFLKYRSKIYSDLGCFAMEATFFLKIAHILGISLEIKSPYVPQGLIEMGPLDQYVGYDFFPEIEAYIDKILQK